MQETSNNLPATTKSLSHMAYHIHEDVGGKVIRTQIGVVWQHRDRKGGAIYVNGLPANGRIVFRSVKVAAG